MEKGWFVTTTTAFSIYFIFLQTLNHVQASFNCYGDFSTVKYGANRDSLFSSLPTNVVSNGGFYNTSLGRGNSRVHVVALCIRGYDKQACEACLEHVIKDTKDKCPRQKEYFAWVTHIANDVACNLRYTNHSTFGNLELSPSTVNANPKSIDSPLLHPLVSQQWNAMVNRTLEAASTADNSSVLKYYSATRTQFTEIPDVYALMQCTPDLLPKDCRRCLRECVRDFQEQLWERQGGGVGRPSCYFRWDLFEFYRAFDNVTRVLAPSPCIQASSSTTSVCERKNKGFEGRTIAIIVIPGIIYLIIFVCLISFWKRKSSNSRIKESYLHDDQSMLRFDLEMILTATHDFSLEKKLGEGGFGSVYKGVLPNGQEVAVKRLAKGSGQGDKEFKNEVSLLARLQHRNLVKLLGFCNEGDEEVLVYEFVPNSSLDRFTFDEEKRSFLTWEVRCKIMQGIARGLVYLHEDSQLKVIHRDLKASNILLDADMNPKVADFGTAKLFNADETRAVTRRIAGTLGYMAPEYLTYGQISPKSDVYSFGIMLLEMISGERNNSFEGEGIAAFTWKRWLEGKPEIAIDPFLLENNPRNEIINFIQIGLVCVQEQPAKRPNMSSVMFWLGSDTITIPVPKAPAAFNETQSQSENGTMSMSKVFTELSVR